jgi:hypothetical protein
VWDGGASGVSGAPPPGIGSDGAPATPAPTPALTLEALETGEGPLRRRGEGGGGW